jgi:hypothetical protein
MILYDWKKVWYYADGNAKEVYRIIKMITDREIPYSKKDPIYKYYGKDFAGNSFLLHPENLIFNSYKHEYKDIGVYLALASLRSYADFKLTGDTTLDIMAMPFGTRELSQNNELLSEKHNRMSFLYEEVTQENIH